MDNDVAVLKKNLIFCLLLIAIVCSNSYAANVVPNVSFDTDLTGWVTGVVTANGTTTWDGTTFGVASGSMNFSSNIARRNELRGVDSIHIPQIINQSDPVSFSFYWYKYSGGVSADRNEIIIYATEAGTSTQVELWNNSQVPAADQFLDGNVVSLDVSAAFPSTNNYYLVLSYRLRSGNNSSALAQFNIDDIVLDVPIVVNNAPTVSSGVTFVSPITVNRFGTDSSIISTSLAQEQPCLVFRRRMPIDQGEFYRLLKISQSVISLILSITSLDPV